MKKLYKYLVFSFLGLLTGNLFAMPLDSIGVANVNGQRLIKYEVSKKETLYRISRDYDVSVDQLKELNPELAEGLKAGQVILIPSSQPVEPAQVAPIEKPVEEETNTVRFETAQREVTHEVVAGETYYALSRKYNVSVAQLQEWNGPVLNAGTTVVVGKEDLKVETVEVEQPKTETPEPEPKVEVQEQVEVPAETPKEPSTVTVTETQETEVRHTPITDAIQPKEEAVAETPKEEPKTTPKEEPAQVAATEPKEDPKPEVEPEASIDDWEFGEPYPFDEYRQQVIVIPFDPHLYFSDCDQEIANQSKIEMPEVRQVFRRRLNALLDPEGYETIHLMGGRFRDSDTLADLQKVYKNVRYNLQEVLYSEHYLKYKQEKEERELANDNSIKGRFRRMKKKVQPTQSEDAPEATFTSRYYGVRVDNPRFFEYFQEKYSADYFIFVSQFEVQTNYEHCLDRAAQNYERTFTTHFTIMDKNGNLIGGNKFRVPYHSNNNNVKAIVAENMGKVAERIMLELPPVGK